MAKVKDLYHLEPRKSHLHFYEFSEAQIADIKARRKKWESHLYIGRIYGVSSTTIKRVCLRYDIYYKRKPPKEKPEQNKRPLTQRKANRIRKLISKGWKTKELSEKFNVGYKQINRIKNNKTWVK